MKGTERHRLKENEVSLAIARATSAAREHARTIGPILAVAVLALVLAVGYWAWRTRSETRAQVMLGEAIAVVQAPIEAPKAGAAASPNTYPTVQARAEAALAKLTEAADAYPSTKGGVAARYYAAAALVMLGRPEDAVARYREVVDRAGANDFYGRMAQLGVVEASAQAGQFDQAVTAAQGLVDQSGGDDVIPRDALLMELGRAQLRAGKTADARQTLDRIVKEFPASAYLEEARELLANL